MARLIKPVSVELSTRRKGNWVVTAPMDKVTAFTVSAMQKKAGDREVIVRVNKAGKIVLGFFDPQPVELNAEDALMIIFGPSDVIPPSGNGD